MSDRPIIEVENLGKRYHLGGGAGGGGGASYRTLRETLSEGARRLLPGRRSRGGEAASPTDAQEFWALKDVSFQVAPGEVVGIIGRNGAGKSTLLKILSRITEPTQGRVTLRGRVASLLEVGTGFHPELTGRENIFLNGAVLGMHRKEIRAKFDEIVAFAEVERFLDTPVKRYSSGMYVRLAFAVAAHLEPEILIVDEVLAVGDAEFQKKCLGKMESVAKGEGRTVLFVSHNMGAVRGLCKRGIVLAKGQATLDGSIDDAIDHYILYNVAGRGAIEWDSASAPRNSRVRFIRAYLLDELNQTASVFGCSNPFHICLEYEVLHPIPNLRIGFVMQSAKGVDICGSNDEDSSHGRTVMPGRYVTRCRFPANVLNVGRYDLDFGADAPNGEMPVMLTGYCMSFNVEDGTGHGPSRMVLPGIIRPELHWSRGVTMNPT